MNDPPATGPAVPRPGDIEHPHEVLLHELRTPLTVVVLRLALLRRHMRRGDGHGSLEEELDRVEEVLGQLVSTIARFDEARRNADSETRGSDASG